MGKGHGKDSIRDVVRHEGKPRTQPGHYKDSVMTTKRQKRTNPGQAEDEKGLVKGRTNRKYNFNNSFYLTARKCADKTCLMINHSACAYS